MTFPPELFASKKLLHFCNLVTGKKNKVAKLLKGSRQNKVTAALVSRPNDMRTYIIQTAPGQPEWTEKTKKQKKKQKRRQLNSQTHIIEFIDT